MLTEALAYIQRRNLNAASFTNKQAASEISNNIFAFVETEQRDPKLTWHFIFEDRVTFAVTIREKKC